MNACGDEGSGGALSIALVAGCLAVALAALAAFSALPLKHEVQAAADSAALAAADTASGRIPGVPCELAAQAAALNGADLTGCSVAGPEATVTAARTVLGVTVAVSARAGPPTDAQPAAEDAVSSRRLARAGS